MVGRHAAPRARRRGLRRLAVLGLGVVVLLGVGAVAVANIDGPVATTTSTPSSLVTTTTTPPTVTLTAVGDSELGNTPQVVSNPAAWFAPVKAALTGDVVFANLEGTLTNTTTSKCGAPSPSCYAFRVPPAMAEAYRAAGFTVLNSANNHAYDFGTAGAASTTAALAHAGITQAGLPGTIGLVDVHGVKVAFCDFAPYGNTNNLLNFAAAAALIKQAHREAAIVVVYMHAGAEGTTADHVTRATETYYGENRGNPYAFAHAAVLDGANLVIASGPHVLRGLEWYRGVLIDYSMGDFTNFHNFATVGDLDLSEALHVTFYANGYIANAAFTSLRLSSAGQATIDPTRASASFVNALSRSDFPSSDALVEGNGTISQANIAAGLPARSVG